LKPVHGQLVLGRTTRPRLGAERTIATTAPTKRHDPTESTMSAISTPPVTTPLTTHRTTPRSAAGASWALLAALVIGAAGGAGVSAVVVHSQVQTVHDTVYVPVPSAPGPLGSGNVQRKV
jgi:hypothetical protein